MSVTPSATCGTSTAPVSVPQRISGGSGGVAARLAQIRRAGADGASSYLAAVGVRTAARALWGLALPAVLSVAAYGQYNLLATLVAMAVQLAVLGAPQALVQQAGRAVPTAALLAHAVGLGLLAVGVATVVFPMEDRRALLVAVGAVCCTAVAALLAARAKSRFAFGISLRAELFAALGLLGGLAVLLVRGRSCGGACVDATQVVLVEAMAVAAAGLVFLAAGRTRLRREDFTLRGARPLLGSVYSVGFLVVLDIIIWRRLEVYFLERSPEGLAAVAVFGLALQLAMLLLLVPTSILEAWQPQLAIHYRTDLATFAEYLRARQRTFLQCLAATAAAGLVVPAAAVMLVFPKYLPWIGYIVAFVMVRIACAVAGFYSATLYATGRERCLYRPVLVASAIALAANAALTPRFGLAGALMATVLTQGTVCVLTLRAFRAATHADAAGREVASGVAAAASPQAA